MNRIRGAFSICREMCWEWTADWYQEGGYSSATRVIDPIGPQANTNRVVPVVVLLGIISSLSSATADASVSNWSATERNNNSPHQW